MTLLFSYLTQYSVELKPCKQGILIPFYQKQLCQNRDDHSRLAVVGQAHKEENNSGC